MRRGFARTLTNLGEAATLSVIACYVIGFIIVNSYLLTYGYIGSSIFKVQYIGAGLLFLVILLLLVALLYPIDWALSRPEERSAKTPSYSYWALSQPEVYTPKTPPRIRQAIIAGPSICMFALWQFSEKFTSADIRIEHETWWLEWLPVAFMIVWLLLLSFENTRNWKAPEKHWVRLSLNCLYVGLGLGFFFLQYKIWNILFLVPLVLTLVGMQQILSKRPLLEQFREWPVEPIYQILVAGSLFLLGIVLFGTNFYGHVNPNYGGGVPPHVRLVLNADGKKAVEKLGYELPSNDTLENIKLIETNDQEYLVIVKWSDKSNGGLVQLKRAHIDSMLYLPTTSK